MFTLSEVEDLFRAIAHIHRHPDPDAYVHEAATAWQKIVSPEPPAEESVPANQV